MSPRSSERSGIIFILMSLYLSIGLNDAYAVDPVRVEKDRAILQRREELIETQKVLRAKTDVARHKSTTGFFWGPYAPLGFPLVAGVCTYDGLRSRGESPNRLRDTAAMGASAVAAVFGFVGGVAVLPLGLLGMVYDNYYLNTAETLDAKLTLLKLELKENANEIERIESKDTSLTWVIKTWSLEKNRLWELVKAQIDEGADFSEQDSVLGPHKSAADLVKSQFPQIYVNYMLEHEKKLKEHIRKAIDLVCASFEVGPLNSKEMQMPMDVIAIMVSYVSNETELQRVSLRKIESMLPVLE